MKSIPTLIAAVIAAAVVAFIVVRLSPPSTTERSDAPHYTKILKSKTIRCGYVLDAPGTMRDPNSGRMSGVVPEALEIAAKALNYKIEWTEEASYSTMIQGLRANRYDAICSSTYYNAARSQFTEAVTPLYYTLVFAYARPDDHRFDGVLAAANDPRVKIATLDGEITQLITAQQFPRATVVALPQNADLSQVLLSVADRKADLTFVESFLADKFLRSHPGAIRKVSASVPLRTYANVMLVGKGDYRLKGLLDAMITETNSSGDMERLLQKYDPDRMALYPVALPYRSATTNSQ